MLDGTSPQPSFTTEFARLNARQREAVTHPDGPVLVVAGPGTGKTQLLAARVAWLLQQPDARPQEILCLTYTEAAARNMRERLLRFIGPAAHRVAIHTFHSFGQLIIGENADRLGYHELTVASELEIELLFRELLDGLPQGHLLRRDTGSDPYYEIKRLKPLLEAMNREGWSEALLAQKLEEYRLSLPLDDEYIYKVAVKSKGANASDVNQAKLAKEEERIELTRAAIELFEPYRRALLARQRYTYDDMLGWATKLLKDDEGLLQSYQERFQHFLVDEYQDTNGAQSQLLHLLAGYWDCPSVLAVGDDDQSIYRFQGASVANVLDFTRRYPSARIVVLEENYRSSEAVLTAAGALIAHNEERLTRQLPDIVKQLVARHPRFAASAVAAPVLRSYESPLHEAAHVAAEIVALHQSGWPAGGGAVLVHNHDQHELLARLLTAAGVPYHRSRKVNVLTTEPLAASLHRVLTYVGAALQPDPGVAEAALFNVLHLEALAVPPVELVRLAAGYRARHGHAHRDGVATALPWRDWAAQATTDDALAQALGLSAEGRAALRQALARLDGWVQAAASQPLPALLELVCLETLLPAHLVAHPHPRTYWP
ncbi:ATP-dependent helicase [Hymenobacter sp. DG25B]|uniref:ATP-dependent helicase n=1 Tax=Hymenobacter sp. DG25B TaxID=1385664 RepID=UPI0018CCABE3|nr:ATP-dependent helicase [Hymenobacter sp. DG25B]